jgi:hypothetical protein
MNPDYAVFPFRHGRRLMKLATLGTSILFFGLILVGGCYAGEGSLSITEMTVEPAAAAPGEMMLISCRVIHAKGPMFIERVAATMFHAEHNSSYPMLFDDGTHGDRTARDGVFSLQIKVPEVPGEGRLIFEALAVDKVEIESMPISFAVRNR